MNRTTSASLGVLALIILVTVAVYVFEKATRVELPEAVPATSSTPQEESMPEVNVDLYITENISRLSPEPEVLGGTYYVTNVVSSNGMGVVSYEDGHNAYTADFTYSVNAEGAISIDTFVVRAM